MGISFMVGRFLFNHYTFVQLHKSAMTYVLIMMRIDSKAIKKKSIQV